MKVTKAYDLGKVMKPWKVLVDGYFYKDYLSQKILQN